MARSVRFDRDDRLVRSRGASMGSVRTGPPSPSGSHYRLLRVFRSALGFRLHDRHEVYRPNPAPDHDKRYDLRRRRLDAVGARHAGLAVEEMLSVSFSENLLERHRWSPALRK